MKSLADDLVAACDKIVDIQISLNQFNKQSDLLRVYYC